MNGYERLLKVIDGRQQTRKDIRIGEMTANFGCKIGELELFNDDLIFSEQLLTGYYKGKESFVPPLKKGDTVLVLKISGELYAVVSRLKGAEE